MTEAMCLLSTKACKLFLLATSYKIMNLDMSIGNHHMPTVVALSSCKVSDESRQKSLVLLASEESPKSR